jgi:hypothetical protein
MNRWVTELPKARANLRRASGKGRRTAAAEMAFYRRRSPAVNKSEIPSSVLRRCSSAWA